MMEWLQTLMSGSAIPNPHAAIIHFPVALLPTALVLDLGALLFRRRVWMEKAAAAMYFLGTVGAAVAYLTGIKASESMWKISENAQATMRDHKDLALVTLLAFSAITLLRVIASWLARNDKVVPIGFFRLLGVIAAMAGIILLAATADFGGRLVYRHGMGVQDAPAGVLSADSYGEDPLEP
jgi:uncharacterized membrane protein